MFGNGRAIMTALRCLVLAMVLLAGSAAAAAELMMFRRAGCPWCQAWDREVGIVYDKTDIGQRVPLRMVDLDGERPAVALSHPVRFSPTFVLTDRGREIARIEGYPGEDFFWGLLERAIHRLPSGRE
jgi:thioredoxin-related protein